MASIYDEQLLTDADLERIRKLSEAWMNTSDRSKKDMLHSAAESIRNGYGYSGGGDGGQYIVTNADVNRVAAADSAYSDALRNAENGRQQKILYEQEKAETDGNDRLREAYIKNMQTQLGLDQSLKADGITGGMSESTLSSLANNYNLLRHGIKKDREDAIRELSLEALNSQLDSDREVAKAEKDSASNRSKMLADYDNEQYQRNRDKEADDFEKLKFAYQKQLDEYDRKYQKQKDENELAYKKQKDANDLAVEKQKISASAKSSGSSSSSDLSKLQSNAWKLLSNGVYDDSFPALLGIDEDKLKEYVRNVLDGY